MEHERAIKRDPTISRNCCMHQYYMPGISALFAWAGVIYYLSIVLAGFGHGGIQTWSGRRGTPLSIVHYFYYPGL
jgi:hypothetical protein